MTEPFKRIELTLTIRKGPNQFELGSVDKIYGDTFVEVLAQLPLVIATYMSLEIEYLKRHYVDDDIPF